MHFIPYVRWKICAPTINVFQYEFGYIMTFDYETERYFWEHLDLETTFYVFMFFKFLFRYHLYPCLRIPLLRSTTMTYYVRLHYVFD